jgi:hypothetical protein
MTAILEKQRTTRRVGERAVHLEVCGLASVSSIFLID